MLKIYFDDVLIDEDSNTALNNEYKLFNDSFKLGSVASNSFKLSVNKAMVENHPNQVKIEDNNTTFYLVVDSFTEDRYVYNYTLVDKLINFNFNYDASEIINEKAELEETCYLSDIWHDMCSQAGVDYDETYAFMNDIEVSWYDNTMQARKYLSFIATLQGGYATILPNGKQTFKPYKKASSKTIDIDECSDFTLGEKKTITRVVWDNGVQFWSFGDDTGTTIYLDTSNPYVINEEVVENIYDAIVGLEFYLVDVPQCPIDSSTRAGDIITFTDGVNNYPTIAQYSTSYGGGWVGGYSTKLNTDRQEETKVTGTNDNIKKIQSEIDRTNATLNIVAQEKVGKDEVISSINLSPEGVKIQSPKLSLEGYTTINNNFSIDEHGNAKIGSLVNSSKYNLVKNSSGLFDYANVTVSTEWTGMYGVRTFKNDPEYFSVVDSGSIYQIVSYLDTGEEYILFGEIEAEGNTNYILSLVERVYPDGDYYEEDFAPNIYYVKVIESFSETFSEDKTTTIFDYGDLYRDEIPNNPLYKRVYDTFTTDEQTIKLKIKVGVQAMYPYHPGGNAIFLFGDLLLDKNNSLRPWAYHESEQEFGTMEITPSYVQVYDNTNENVLARISKGGFLVPNDAGVFVPYMSSDSSVKDWVTKSYSVFMAMSVQGALVPNTMYNVTRTRRNMLCRATGTSTYDIISNFSSNEVVLYNDSTGSNGTITLSETSANFSYIEIFYRSNLIRYRSIKIYSPNGKYADLSIIDSNGTNGQIWIKQNMCVINGTNISPSNYAWKRVDAAADYGADNLIYITRVVGYR